mgnify:CR=1 FL=1
MNKYKICIYAICKNEEKYIDTWYNSVKEADKIFILDTGSTDNTFNLLKDKEKVTIKKEIIKRMKNVISLPSFTSREPREGEEEGIQYHFITKEQFKEFRRLVEQSAFWCFVLF